jgi:hypothetical protein
MIRKVLEDNNHIYDSALIKEVQDHLGQGIKKCIAMHIAFAEQCTKQLCFGITIVTGFPVIDYIFITFLAQDGATILLSMNNNTFGFLVTCIISRVR